MGHLTCSLVPKSLLIRGIDYLRKFLIFFLSVYLHPCSLFKIYIEILVALHM